jgi:hypothetical protein
MTACRMVTDKSTREPYQSQSKYINASNGWPALCRPSILIIGYRKFKKVMLLLLPTTTTGSYLYIFNKKENFLLIYPSYYIVKICLSFSPYARIVDKKLILEILKCTYNPNNL